MTRLFLENPSELQRLATLDSFNILDTAPEAGFDDIVMLARHICETPIALVSLVAANRQWFKAVAGLGVCETPLDQSVCRHALQQHETLIIPDLTKDPRTRDNTLVTGEPFIRFYAGALLLTTSGIPVGTLCVIDTKPRPEGLTSEQRISLEALARQVMAQLELRRAMAVGESAFADKSTESDAHEARAVESERLGLLLKNNEARLRIAQEIGKVGSFEVDIASNQIAATEELCRIYGLSHRVIFDFSELERLIYPPDRPLVTTSETRQRGEIAAHVEYRIFHGRSGEMTWVSRRAQVMHDAFGNPHRIVGTVQDVTERKAAEERQRVLNDELSHRMKNTMAMVQAIASQTLRNASDREAVRAFNQRITALSHAHEVLLQQNWVAANLEDVLKSVLSLHGDASRFSFSGPVVNLGSKAALSLSLLVHELATNALKHGALSVPEGHIEISWSNAEDNLALRWRERGGPETRSPERAGLGTRLIDMGISGTGVASKRYDSTGFTIEFRAALKFVEEN